MSQETLNTLLAGAAALASLVSVCLAVAHNRQRAREREEDRRLVEEQLALAREQHEMRPRLRVRSVRLLSPRDWEAMEGSVDPRWIGGLRNLRGNVKKADLLAMVTGFIQQGRLMERSAADKVVVLEVASEGKTAASLTAGWVYLDAGRMEPTNPSGGPGVSEQGGEYRVAVVGDDRATVIPLHRAVFLPVHVAVLSSGDTRIRYDLVSLEDEEARGDWMVPT